MKITPLIKKSFYSILSICMLLAISGCGETQDVSTQNTDGNDVFTQNPDGNLVSPSGVEYAHLTNEGFLYYLGDLVFQGGVSGQEETSQHWGYSYQTGLFSTENDDTHNILIRRTPDSEWFSIYRKTSLPQFDYSVDNCSRLELVTGTGNSKDDVIHASCGDGIDSASEIAEFLSDVRSQKDPFEAGLFDLVTKPDGFFENCYTYAVIYGFFQEEPNLVVCMSITSYNDLAYSVTIEQKEYVLPEEWLQRLLNN